MNDDSMTLENAELKDEASIDIKNLLEAANASRFAESETLLRGKETFEKANSFFELIKSEPAAQTDPGLETDQHLSESETKEKAGEDLPDDVDYEPLGENQFEENVDSQPADMNANLDSEDTEISDNSEIVEDENLDLNNELKANEQNEASFETVEVVKEIIESSLEEENDKNEERPNIEQSEEYQRGYQEALIEFEKTLQAEKKAIADFANTLFEVRDDLSSLIEENISEKLKEISEHFLGERIDEVPGSLIERVKEVSLEIIENAKQFVLELNEIDAIAFIEKSSEFPFQIVTTSELARGEFRIIAGKSGYHQKIVN
jgi:hypothetical protein